MEFKGGSTVSRTSHDFGVSAVDPDGCRLPGALAVLVWVLMCSIRGLPPSDWIELSPMLNVVGFGWSSGIEVDEEDAPVAVVTVHSAPVKAEYLKADGGGAFSSIAPVMEVMDISLKVEASSLIFPVVCGDRKRFEEILSGPMDSQLIESFPCQGRSS